jgi:hypothetical protein
MHESGRTFIASTNPIHCQLAISTIFVRKVHRRNHAPLLSYIPYCFVPMAAFRNTPVYVLCVRGRFCFSYERNAGKVCHEAAFSAFQVHFRLVSYP